MRKTVAILSIPLAIVAVLIGSLIWLPFAFVVWFFGGGDSNRNSIQMDEIFAPYAWIFDVYYHAITGRHIC